MSDYSNGFSDGFHHVAPSPPCREHCPIAFAEYWRGLSVGVMQRERKDFVWEESDARAVHLHTGPLSTGTDAF
jgi:hypothetical protein